LALKQAFKSLFVLIKIMSPDKPTIVLSGWAGNIRCPKDGIDVSVYESGAKMNDDGTLKFLYACATRKDCKKEGFCAYRDSWKDGLPFNL
jgi:hypothetical protein